MCEGEKTRRKKEKKRKRQRKKREIKMILESEMYGWKKKKKDGRKLYILNKKREILCHNIFITFHKKF